MGGDTALMEEPVMVESMPVEPEVPVEGEPELPSEEEIPPADEPELMLESAAIPEGEEDPETLQRTSGIDKELPILGINTRRVMRSSAAMRIPSPRKPHSPSGVWWCVLCKLPWGRSS